METLLLAALLSLPAASAPPADKDRLSVQIQGLRQDSRMFVGVGETPYTPPDVGDARGKALRAAEKELLETVAAGLSAKARALLRYELSDRTGIAERSLGDLLRDFASREIRRKRVIEFQDFPKRGRFTAAVLLMKADAERDLETELAAKRDIVIADVNDASITKMGRDWALALRACVMARDNLEFFFPYIPVRGVVSGAPDEVVLSRHIEGRIKELVERIEIVPVRETSVYGIDGRLRQPLELLVRYPFPEGSRPIPEVVLDLRVAKGSGRLAAARVTTDAWGKAVVPLEWADPSGEPVSIEVRVDTAALPGKPELAAAPAARVQLTRGRAVAFSLLARADTGKADLPVLRERVRALLLRNGFDSVALELDSHVLDEAGIEKARQTKADFLLLVDFLASTKREEEFQMYTAQARARFALYKLPDGVEAFQDAAPGGQGRSADLARAVSYAADRVEPALLRLLRERIEQLR